MRLSEPTKRGRAERSTAAGRRRRSGKRFERFATDVLRLTMDGYDDDDNDLDNLVENRGHDEEDADDERQRQNDEREGLGDGEAAEEKVVPVKIRVKKPQPKLDPAR